MDSAMAQFMLKLISILKHDKSLDDETRDNLRKLEQQLEIYNGSSSR